MVFYWGNIPDEAPPEAPKFLCLTDSTGDKIFVRVQEISAIEDQGTSTTSRVYMKGGVKFEVKGTAENIYWRIKDLFDGVDDDSSNTDVSKV